MPEPNGQDGESYIDRIRLRNCGDDLLREQAILRETVQRLVESAKLPNPRTDQVESGMQSFERGMLATKQKLDALIALADETFRRKPTQTDTDAKNPGNHS